MVDYTREDSICPRESPLWLYKERRRRKEGRIPERSSSLRKETEPQKVALLLL